MPRRSPQDPGWIESSCGADDADTIRARIGQEAADALEAKLTEWFGNDSALGGYDADAVLEMGKHAI